MNGPWIHQNILETIQNIKVKKKSITGGIKVNGLMDTALHFLIIFIITMRKT